MAVATHKSFPTWAFLSLATNVLLVATVILLIARYDRSPSPSQIKISAIATPAMSSAEEAVALAAKLQSRQQLTYTQWVDLLKHEAKAVAKNKPDRLTVLAGDSLSLWFPSELLPSDRTWLNQSISGETSTGLLKRLNLLKDTEPQAIFVMIGINDLAKGSSDQDVLETYRQIIDQLKQAHPKSKLVVQSILPHSANPDASLEKRQQLLETSNERIHTLNRAIETLTKESGVAYLNLQPLFADSEGYLRSELTTDGLHLNRQGYLVWRSAIQTFSQLALDSRSAEKP
ncbi:MAG: GDSL-type esterase/lipase family protein [Phormidesmis sp. CAN_BIN44]|nr:GDSL-type esterase/lipase family protein [Phormidesmis sp. CAN_BIN44]